MDARNWFLILLVLAVVASCAPSDTSKEQTIELEDGSRVVLRADGSMGHYSAAGRPVTMAEGEVMIARDGTRVLMKAEALWRQIAEQAAADFAVASAPPWLRVERDERWIDLADGGRIMLRNDGTMRHVDAAGTDVSMAEGELMIAKDGTRILMNKGTLWSPATGRPARHPGQ